MPTKQPDLFAETDPAAVAPELGLRIQGTSRKPLSKAQKRFNTLLKELERLRSRLVERRELDERVRDWVQELLVPLMAPEMRAQRSLILSLHELLQRKGARKAPRSRAKRALIEEDLLMRCISYLHYDETDQTVRDIHDAYSPISYGEVLAAVAEDRHPDCSEMFADDDLPEGLTAQEIEELVAQAFAEVDGAGSEFHRPPRKQSAKAQKRAEQRAAAEEQARREVSQSVREVYRKLVSALHPDRASDDSDRQRRHDLMQRVNGCYESSDLLGLLSLQLEIEQIDDAHLATVSEQRLQHYNQVLRDQSSELKNEIEAIEQRLRAVLTQPVRDLNANVMRLDLETCAAGARRQTEQIEQLARGLDEPGVLSAWLQRLEEERRERELAEEEDAQMDAILDALFAGTFDADDDFDEPGASPPWAEPARYSGRLRKPSSAGAGGKTGKSRAKSKR